MKAGEPAAHDSACILVADDQPDVIEAIRLLLKGEGIRTLSASSPREVLEHVKQHRVDAALVDLNYARDTTSGREGLELLEELRAVDRALPVVVMTAWATIDTAVQAMQRGARDYIEKPWDNERLLTTLRTQLAVARAIRERADLARDEPGFHAPGADSPAMRPILALARRIAASDATVLISGEHGTGKEVLARRIHAASRRAEKPFVAINAGGYSEHLVESELFGHVRGAFTDARSDRAGAFEAAHGGTLFLDEIGNMPLQQQAKLLRVLQTGELYRVGSSKVVMVDVRMLAATNADLGKEVAAGAFRADLLYRLNTVELRLPALRARPEDIPALADHFLAKWSKRMERTLAFSEDANARLLEYAWPGNVRELEHVVERAAVLAPSDIIDASLLGLDGNATPTPLPDAITLEQAERYLIDRALERASGNVNEAARELGLSRSALYRRLQRFAPPRS
ncbi:MAG TPA: sigma-54 dependent transcriptional regulator [Polyangiaceae bacterium]|nr:sigma-54 dependent transcriptional regulator [Polyangiaceae bacterium]